jgi:hypothetical protein
MRASFRIPDSIRSYSPFTSDLQVRRFFFHDYVTDLQQQSMQAGQRILFAGYCSQRISFANIVQRDRNAHHRDGCIDMRQQTDLSFRIKLICPVQSSPEK